MEEDIDLQILEIVITNFTNNYIYAANKQISHISMSLNIGI